MSKFDDREKSFEKKFVRDEELQFKINAKRNNSFFIPTIYNNFKIIFWCGISSSKYSSPSAINPNSL